MGALGTGLSQSYQSKQQSDALKGLFGGGGGITPPAPGGEKGGGLLKSIMGMFGGGGDPAGGEAGGVPNPYNSLGMPGPMGQKPPSVGAAMGNPNPAPAGGGIMVTLKGMFGGGGAPPIQSSLTRNMPGGGPKMGASSLFQLLMPK